MEYGFERPGDFEIRPGQKITFYYPAPVPELSRDYTLINAFDDDELTICVRTVPSGRFTPHLARASVGDRFEISKPHGYFAFQPSSRKPVFVATGTGIAPFVAFVRSGVRDFLLLHGVQSRKDLYYLDILAEAARIHVACLSADTPADTIDSPSVATEFPGRVTGYLRERLPDGAYDFYLCGRGEMVEEAVHIVDDRFPGSLVFSEPFF